MTEDEMAGWHHQLNGHEFAKETNNQLNTDKRSDRHFIEMKCKWPTSPETQIQTTQRSGFTPTRRATASRTDRTKCG